MKSIMCVIGTRPEAIKVAPVIWQLRAEAADFRTIVCLTGQHREMVEPLIDLLNLQPNHDLRLMEHDQSLNGIAGRVFHAIDIVLQSEKPDWLLVQGDTTTAMVAGIAAAYRRIKVGHIEAGLRTFDKNHPFPEEINRRLLSAVTDLHFAPTRRAVDNLVREGHHIDSVILTGNTVIDALQYIAEQSFDKTKSQIADVPSNKRIILVTAHRRENHGQPLEEIFQAVRHIARQNEESVHFVYPVHLNPHVRRLAHELLSNIPNITLCEPLDYQTLIQLMKSSFLILTDSGGIQEEAPSFGVPVLILRQTTERLEAIETGSAKLVGADKKLIISLVQQLLDDNSFYESMSKAINPFGDGHARLYTVDALKKYEL